MGKIIIATCGTSVLTNHRTVLKKVIGDKFLNEITKEEAEQVKEKVLEALSDKKAQERECGAEVNSTYYLMKKPELEDIEKVYLIVSDSNDGRAAGEIIKQLFSDKLGIEKVEIKEIEKLTVTKEFDFAKKGLRNLAAKTAGIIKQHNYQDIVISPIGGLKAQIFIVGLIAQLFKIPAYYLYENSTNIIELLPLPIALDTEFFINNTKIIKKIYEEELILKKELAGYLKNHSELRNILEEITMDGETYFGLSMLGIIMYEKLVADIQIKLPRVATPKEKYNEVMYKNNEPHADQVRTRPDCQKLLKSILNLPYVTKVIINYYNPKNKGDVIRFTKSSSGEERVIRLEFNRKEGMLGGDIYITEPDNDEVVEAVIMDMEMKFI